MNVAVVCPYSFDAPGGVQEHARGLSRALRDLGCEVSLFAPDMGRGADMLDGILTVSLGRSVRIPANGSIAPIGVDPRMLPRLELALDSAEVVHLHEPFQPACVAAALRTPRGIPRVGTFHAAADRSPFYAATRPFLPALARLLTVTSATSTASRALVRRYVRRVDPVIVPNGVNVAEFEAAEPDPWMASLPRSVLFVGRPEPRKGLQVALSAFARVADAHPDAHLVTNVAPELAGEVDGVPAGRVHHVGPQTRARLVSLFKAADVFVAPNLGSESFGIVVAEALAAGCAVLASDLPGFRSCAGEAAWYASPGDLAVWSEALDRLLGGGEDFVRLRQEAPARAAIFDWPVIAERMLALYDDALARL